MWKIAYKTLVADRGKFYTALVGVVFSIVLVNIQGGLFIGLIRKASMLVDHGQADIWVGHKNMHNVDFPRDIPRRWIYRIRTLPGVEQAEPYMIGFTDMTLPSGGFENVVVIGVDRSSNLGSAWDIVEGDQQAILKTDGVIVDRSENQKLEHPEIGDVREIGGRRARIAAKSEGIMGFLVAPYIFTAYDRAADYLHKSPDDCSYILVKTAPNTDPEQICAAIRQRLPDVEAFSKQRYSSISINFWMTRTGLGISFGAATLLGLCVGLVMVAQTLYASALDRISEFGALKAIGADEGQIYSLLYMQALVIAFIGAILGLFCVFGIQYFFSSPRAPIVIPSWLSLGSTVLVLVICLLASLLPYIRIRKVDPLMVLQG